MDLITIVSALILLVPCLLQHTNSVAEAFLPSQHFFFHNHSSALTKSSFHRRRVGGSLAASIKDGDDDDDDGKKQNQRRPWDILRFISQSSKFIRPPSLPQIIIGAVAGGKNTRKIGPGRYITFLHTAHNAPYLAYCLGIL